MKRAILRWLPLLAWMAVIFLISADPNPYESVCSELQGNPPESCRPAPQVVTFLSNDTLGEIGHLAEYIVLGFLTVWALYPGRSPLRLAALAVVLCLLYALSDEIHQIFVPGRAFQLVDLALDLIGCTIGMWIGFGVFHICAVSKKNKNIE